MKRLIATIVTLGLMVVILATPSPALAHHSSGHFWGGFAAGAATGLIVGQAFVPRVYYAPPPIVHPGPAYHPYAGPVYYPAATCYDYWVNGYWYYGTWVPAHWERACR